MKGPEKGGRLAGRGEQDPGALLGLLGGGDRVDLRLAGGRGGAGGAEATGREPAVGVGVGDETRGTVGHGSSCGVGGLSSELDPLSGVQHPTQEFGEEDLSDRPKPGVGSRSLVVASVR